MYIFDTNIVYYLGTGTVSRLQISIIHSLWGGGRRGNPERPFDFAQGRLSRRTPAG